MSEKKGKVKEVAGFVTGDRHVEAAGRAEQRAADREDPVEDVDEGAVSQEEHSVRKEHGDLPAKGGGPAGAMSGATPKEPWAGRSPEVEPIDGAG